MASRSPVEVTDLPSVASIALACLVVKSKPEDETIEDYIKRLRQHISGGSPRKKDHLIQQFDSAMFWKQAYEKSEIRRVRQQDRIYQLEQLLQTDPPTGASNTVTTSKQGKRKRDEPAPAKANNRSKRLTVSPGADDSDSSNFVDFTSGLSNQHASIAGAPLRLLRCLFNLRRSLATPQPDPTALLLGVRVLYRHNLTILIDAIEHELDLSRQSKRASTCNSTSSWDRLAKINVMSNLSAIEALEKISQSKRAKHGDTGTVIAEIVHFFQCILGQMHAVSIQRAKGMEHETSCASRTRSRKLQTENASHNEKAKVVCVRFTTILLTLFSQLSMSSPSHAQLFEGLTCALLDHVGSSLSLVVFADREQESLADQVGVCPPTGLKHADDLGTKVSTNTAALEAPFLVAILKQIMTSLDESPEHAGLLVESTDSSCQSSPELMNRIKKRLQNTLVRGVFGDGNGAFQDALQRADSVDLAEMDESLAMSSVEEMTAEWFIGEVWTHLGWEVLSEHVSGQG